MMTVIAVTYLKLQDGTKFIAPFSQLIEFCFSFCVEHGVYTFTLNFARF